MGRCIKTIPPPYLKQGDTIAIVATARKYSDTLLTETIALIESWGLRVKIGKSVGLSDNQLAGSDQERSHDFQIQLDNPTIKAIWCVKGGYGTVRIIDSLDFTQFKKKPKWIIGFSDITVLHAHINNMHYSVNTCNNAHKFGKIFRRSKANTLQIAFWHTQKI